MNNTDKLSEIKKEAGVVAEEIIEVGGLSAGDILVVGCSSSEIAGGSIGHMSSPEIGEVVYGVISEVAEAHGVFMAAQCCEHLNRALIIEREALASRPWLTPVNVVPQPKAGGSFATAAWKNMKSPVAVEEIKADGGLDIGLTLIGMHLKSVAVPVRLKQNKIGEATVTAARVRPKFIGGSRAVYDENMM